MNSIIKNNIHKTISLIPVSFISNKIYNSIYKHPEINFIIDGNIMRTIPIIDSNIIRTIPDPLIYMDIVVKNDSNRDIHIEKITLQKGNNKETPYTMEIMNDYKNILYVFNNWTRFVYGFDMERKSFYTLSRLSFGENYYDSFLYKEKNNNLYRNTIEKKNIYNSIIIYNNIKTPLMYSELFKTHINLMKKDELKFKVYYKYFKLPYFGYIFKGNKTFYFT